MLCKNCGAQLVGTENVCPNCGTPVEKEVVAEAAPSEVVPEPVAPVEATSDVPSVESPEAVPTENSEPIEPIPENNGSFDNVQTNIVNDSQAMPEPLPQSSFDQNMGMNNPVDAMNNTMTNNAMDNLAQNQAFNNMNQQPMSPQPNPVPQPNVQQPPAQKSGNKTVILLLVLIVLLAVGAALYFALFKDSGSVMTPSDNTNQTTDSISNDTTTEDTISFNGYKFVIPEGYGYEVEDQTLYVYNNDICYTIAIDYSHTYDEYKTAFIQTYPEQSSDVEKTYGSRTYLAVKAPSTAEEYKDFYIVQYATPGSDKEPYTGLIVKADGKQPELSEFNVLTEMLNNAKKEGSSFAPGDVQDIGKDGVKIYTPSKDNIKFSDEKE